MRYTSIVYDEKCERLAVFHMSKQRMKFPIVPVAIVAVVAVILILFISKLSDNEQQVSDTQASLAFLQSLENKDPEAVMEVRRGYEKAKLDAKRDQMIRELTNGTVDPFSYFKDYVVMGDSRAVGFWYRNFLERSRVLADGGHTIRNIEKQMDTLISLNPSMIYLCYGLNDSSIGYWDTAESYVSEYIQIVKTIQEKLPNATIVVSSILPARDPAFERSAKWYNIPEWSAALEKACQSNGILFANCDSLAEDYPNLWDPDGIHFRKEFYPYWASALLLPTLMEEA